ncbi:hypothetical protein CVT24_001416 [Panaeolus cyanescens]|uniref:F-box domain-containing protein n=1 Tax=Panaeolus cyanescens TaxID=181874 RepID=A0A409W3I3_9AGAR|nr:hypothetical protein CVT24_001416 [Panaeolus cyanescens]
MGLDTFCLITGMHHFESRQTILEHLWPSKSRIVRAIAGGSKSQPTSEEDLAKIQHGLFLSRRDVKSSSLMVMIAPEGDPTDLQNAKPNPICAPYLRWMFPEAPKQINETNTKVIPNVRVWNDLSYDQYHDADHRRDEYASEYPYKPQSGSGAAVNYAAYVILRHACPRLLPHVLFIIYHQCKEPDGCWYYLPPEIDYGPVQKVIAQWPEYNNLGWGGADDPNGKPWDQILFQKKSADEILADAWGGRGALWVTVRPNKFPIQETMDAVSQIFFTPDASQDKKPNFLERLPLELVGEICSHLTPDEISPLLGLSKPLRKRLEPYIHTCIYRYIKDEAPWYLPAGPIVFEDPRFGGEEIDAWTTGWSNVGIKEEDIEALVPWMTYLRECGFSLSMRNRKRIWGISKQLEALAIERGLI